MRCTGGVPRVGARAHGYVKVSSDGDGGEKKKRKSPFLSIAGRNQIDIVVIQFHFEDVFALLEVIVGG